MLHQPCQRSSAVNVDSEAHRHELHAEYSHKFLILSRIKAVLRNRHTHAPHHFLYLPQDIAGFGHPTCCFAVVGMERTVPHTALELQL